MDFITWIFSFFRNLINYILCQPRHDIIGTPVVSYKNLMINGLHTWYIPASNDNTIVIYCHGNRRNISSLLYFIKMINKLGISLIVFDYYGFGQSDDDPKMWSEDGMVENTQQIIDYTKKSFPNAKIVMYGHSLGGAIAIKTLANNTNGVYCLICEGTFYSLEKAFIDLGNKYLRISIISKLISKLLGLQNKYRSHQEVKKINIPIIFVHSVDDEVIPFNHSILLANNEKVIKLTGIHRNPNYTEEFYEMLNLMSNTVLLE